MCVYKLNTWYIVLYSVHLYLLLESELFEGTVDVF